MNITVRPADLEIDRELLIHTLFRYLTPLSDDSRFAWLYRNSPHGPARAWIASRTDNNHDIIGIASAFPRRIYVNDSVELGWVLGDFCIKDQYRSLGPALQLQRACLTEVDSGGMTFCYDFPSTSMMAVYKWLGIPPFGKMLRLAKPLRVDRNIKKIVKVPSLAAGLTAGGNLLLRVRDRRSQGNGALMISFHEGNCGEEFSELARQVRGQYGLCVQRSAEYLNWRYLNNPLCRNKILTVRRDSVLLAYAVFTHSSEDTTIVDLFGVDDPVIIGGLIERVVDLSRKRGLITVNIVMVESHPWVTLLRRLGFMVRESKPVVVYPTVASRSRRSIVDANNWLLMQGDRDS